MPRIAIMMVLAAVATGCAGGPGPAQRPGNAGTGAIEIAEIREAQVENVYDLVRNRRPEWLQQRGAMTIRNDEEIIVYLDRARLGGVESMRRIHPQSVTSVSFLDARQASFRYGPGHLHGAIVIATDLLP